jgi:hypothetical protein
VAPADEELQLEYRAGPIRGGCVVAAGFAVNYIWATRRGGGNSSAALLSGWGCMSPRHVVTDVAT